MKTDFNRKVFFSLNPGSWISYDLDHSSPENSSLVCSRGSCKRRLNLGTFCNKVLAYSVTPYYFISIFHSIYLSIMQELRSFRYPLWLVTCDGLLQHLRQLLGFARAVTYKHVERVNPSTPHLSTFWHLRFDWHEKRFFGRWRSSGRIEAFKKMPLSARSQLLARLQLRYPIPDFNKTKTIRFLYCKETYIIII